MQPEELTRQVEFRFEEPVDFTRTDTAAIHAQVRCLLAAAVHFNTLAIQRIGGRLGPARDPGLVEQAIAAGFQTYGGYQPHPDPFDKAAMLLRGLTQGHPFTDANKRTGLLVAMFYLEHVGYPSPDPYPAAAIVELCVRVSAGLVRDVEDIAAELRRLWGLT